MHPTTNRTARAAATERGFSLVELLVAMTLGLILLGGMISVFSGNRRANELNGAMTTMQENARFALNTLAADIRMAGHQGCLDANGSVVEVIAKDAPTADFRETAIGGAVVDTADTWDPIVTLGSGAKAFSPPTTNKAVPGTHVLTVQFGGPRSTVLENAQEVGGVANSTAPLELKRALNITAGDMALVSTCEQGEIFEVTGVAVAGGIQSLSHAASANVRASFLEAYGDNDTTDSVRVMPFSTNVYYVGETGLENAEGDPIRALYQQSAPFDATNNPPVELVRGVENMRLSFGVGDTGGRLRYVDADDSAYDPATIRSVRVGLMMTSIDRIATDADTNTYMLAGQPITPASNATDGTSYRADKRFRLVFNTTVKVRNRRAND